MSLGKRLKKYFLTGLVVLGPLGLTVLVVQWIVSAMDSAILGLLPTALHPTSLVGQHIPGLGVVGTLMLVMMVGIRITSYNVCYTKLLRGCLCS